MIEEVKEEECFFCDAPVALDAQRELILSPTTKGGIESVPCCSSCHDLKKQFPVNIWPAAWVAKIISAFPLLTRERRLYLARMALSQSRVRAVILLTRVENYGNFLGVPKWCLGFDPRSAMNREPSLATR
jgi:hypothetical protein